MAERLAHVLPDARLEGFTVQEMVRRPGAYELIVGASTDPVFGPFLLFGEGGTAVEVVANKALALPPLNAVLAHELVGRTRISKRLRGFRDRAPIDFEALEGILVCASRIMIENPDIGEFEINPLLASEQGVIALDARVRLEPLAEDRRDRLAIRPYPTELEEGHATESGMKIFLRPIRPDDEGRYERFLTRLGQDDVRFRFFNLVQDLPGSERARHTQIDYDREMAFLALNPANDDESEILGVVRAITDPDNTRAELAIVVRSDCKGRGLGRGLLDKMIRYCSSRRTSEIIGRVKATNTAMLDLALGLGFEAQPCPEEGTLELRLRLQSSSAF